MKNNSNTTPLKSIWNQRGDVHIGLVAVFALAFYLFHLGFRSVSIKLILLTLFLSASMIAVGLAFRWKDKYFLRKKKERKQIARFREQDLKEKAIRNDSFSSDRLDYQISNADYKRGNEKEALYRKEFFLRLLKAYENACAKCGASDKGCEIDHFFLSKNEGGNFMMLKNNGQLVNNATILCKSCNGQKKDQSYRSFYSDQELEKIFKINEAMTLLLNEKA